MERLTRREVQRVIREITECREMWRSADDVRYGAGGVMRRLGWEKACEVRRLARLGTDIDLGNVLLEEWGAPIPEESDAGWEAITRMACDRWFCYRLALALGALCYSGRWDEAMG